jgi:hypothetical protein
MVRLYFYVEGQTEQEYVQRVLMPHLAGCGVYVMGAVLAASGKKGGKFSQGGGSRYHPMRQFLGNLLRLHDHADVRFTTMFDLYALGSAYKGFPGWDEAEKQRHIPGERVRTLERAFAADVNDRRFIPHIQLHEFETILLCGPEHLALVYEKPDAGIAALRAAVAQATTPELVDDGEMTAPSKRIIDHFPRYHKTTDGVELAACVGIETTRRLCPHFDGWLKLLESLGSPAPGGTPATPS